MSNAAQFFCAILTYSFIIPYKRKAANFPSDSYVSFVNEQILHLGVLSNYVMPLAKEKNKIRHLNHFDLLLKK